MRATAVATDPAPRREALRPRPQPAVQRVAGVAHVPAVAAGGAADRRELAAAHPETIRGLQRSVGNVGLAAALGAHTGVRRQAPGALLQREGENGDSVTEFAKKTTSVVSELTAETSNIVGTLGSASGRGYDIQATYVGAGVGLLNTGVELLGTAAESYGAMRILLDPAQSQAAQQAALDTLGDSVGKVWSAKDGIVSNATSIASTAAPQVAILATVASAAGMVAAYGDFAHSLVSWGEDWERMQGIQELQFTGWNDPARAAREARGDSSRAAVLLAGAQTIRATAERVSAKNEQTLDGAHQFLQHQGAAVAQTARAIERQPRVSAEMSIVRDATLHNEQDRLIRAQAEYDEIRRACVISRNAVVAADQRVAQSKEMIALAWSKERAVDIFAAELAKAVEQMRGSPDPQGRTVGLEEIRMFAVSQSEIKLTRDTLRTIAAVIGVAAGITIVALGWTPVGWGLVAAAGAVGASILIVKGGRLLMRKIMGTLTPREVYARRLWSYARFGYDIGYAQNPPKDVRLRNGADAVALLHALGISWSQQEILARPEHEGHSAISVIENALKW